MPSFKLILKGERERYRHKSGKEQDWKRKWRIKNINVNAKNEQNGVSLEVGTFHLTNEKGRSNVGIRLVP